MPSMADIRLKRLGVPSNLETPHSDHASEHTDPFRDPTEDPFRPLKDPFRDPTTTTTTTTTGDESPQSSSSSKPSPTPGPPTPPPRWVSLFQFTTKQHRSVLCTAIFLAVAAGLVVPGMSILLGKIFAAFAQFGSGIIDSQELRREVTRQVVVLAALGAGSWMLDAAFVASWILFGEMQAKAARERLFEGLLDKDMRWFDQQKMGVAALISKCQTQIYELQISVSQPLGYTAQASVTAVASMAVALYHSWSLTLVILAGVPILFLLMSILSTRMQPHITHQKEHLSDASRIVGRTMSAIETVKAFNGQTHERDLFARAIDQAARDYRRQARLNALIIGIVRLFTVSMFVQGFYYGSRLVRHGGGAQKAGDMITTFWSCSLATQSLQMIMPHMMVLQKGRAAGAALFDMIRSMERGRVTKEMQGGVKPAKCHGEVEITDVSFAYPSRPNELALKNASFFIPAHETTYIVGRSGSGKSTLGSLLTNTYQPLSGTIFIDGQPIETLSPQWLRENISLLQQQSVLFNETLFRNIAFGRTDYENVTFDDVLGACRMACLESTIHQLQSGLDTMVGVGGSQLSGGQRQRAAIARDKIRDANILICDEATSALDHITRSTVMEAVHQWRSGKTTIIITHDIQEIRPQDFVYVLEQGRVVQDGYRRDLDRKPGPFRSFMDASEEEPLRKESPILETTSTFYDSDSYDSDSRPVSMAEMASFGDQIMELPTILSPAAAATKEKLPSRSVPLRVMIPDLAMVPITVDELSSQPLWSRKGSSSVFTEAGTLGTPETPMPEHRKPRPKRFKMLPRKLPRRRRRRRKRDTSSLRILGTVWATLSFWRRTLLVCGFIAAGLHAAATPVFSYALARLLSSILDLRTPLSEAAKWSLVILGIAIADGVNAFLMHYLLEVAGQAWVDHLRVRALSRILEQPREWFDRDRNAVHRITEDLEKNAEEMRNLLGRFAGFSFVGFVMMALGVVWSFTASWQLTLVGLALAPLLYAVSTGLTWVSDNYESRCNEAAEATGAILKEAVANIRTVRNYALEGFFREKYLKATRVGLKIGVRRAVFAGIGSGMSDSAILFATALVFYVGALLISKQKTDLNAVLIVSTLLLFSLSSANALIGLIPQVSNCKDTACRVLRLANLPLTSHERQGSEQPALTGAGAIAFHGVSFAYPSRPDSLVLRDFDLTIHAGECVAIVGPSGCGKSTVATLLQRLYAPTRGSITLDGHPLHTLDVTHLRAQLAVVSQTPILFDSSIRANIAYPSSSSFSSPTEAEVESAAHAAGIHTTIVSLQHGYSTVLGDNGAGLSGGQAQRVAVARALVRSPRVLLLDEVTSSLDAESARGVRDAVRGIVDRGGTTVVLVTHSVEMMRCAGRIVVLGGGDDGRRDGRDGRDGDGRMGAKVVEQGSFEALMRRKGGELARLLSNGGVGTLAA